MILIKVVFLDSPKATNNHGGEDGTSQQLLFGLLVARTGHLPAGS